MSNRIIGIGIAIISSFCAACGPPLEIPPDTLMESQPKVVSVTPPLDSHWDEEYVEVAFSQPIDSKTLTKNSFAVLSLKEEISVGSLWQRILDGKISTLDGAYIMDETGRTVRFQFKKTGPVGLRYALLVTPQVLSTSRLPLNQTPGIGPTPFFSVFYTTQSQSEVPVDARFEQPAAENHRNAEGGVSTVASSKRPQFLQFFEVYYDSVGKDTEGQLFIELYGEPMTELAGYKILFINGEDGKILESLKISNGAKIPEDGFFVVADQVTGLSGVTQVTGADLVADFDPQNGPDCLQLLDPEDELVEAVGYGTPLVLNAENGKFCYQGTPSLDAPAGKSLSRLKEATASGNNAADFQINGLPSPGSFEVKLGGTL